MSMVSTIINANKKSNLEFAPITMDAMRDAIYNGGEIMSLTPKQFNGEKTQIIDNMLEAMNKLTKLYKVMSKYDGAKVLSHIQPYFKDDQQFRCYLSDSYIVVEVNHQPKNYNSGKWVHIIENHGADVSKGNERWYDFKIIPGFSDEHLIKITEGIETVVETVEKYVYDLMNETQTVFEKIKMIRIGEPTEAELKKQAWANIEVLKEEKRLNMAAKMDKRREWWARIFGESKISFL